MAWPLTPLTTYVAGTTPVVKAADLNSIQSAINGVYAATTSLVAVVVDGTGGATVTPTSGTLKVSAAGSNSNAPPGITIPKGVLYADGCPFAWASVLNNGTSLQGTQIYNVASLARVSAGIVNVNLNTALTSSSTGCVVVSLSGAAGFIQATIASTTQIHTVATNTSNSAADINFMIVVYGT